MLSRSAPVAGKSMSVTTIPARERAASRHRSMRTVLGQRSCFIAAAIALAWRLEEGGKHDGGSVMELRTESPRKYGQTRLLNHCAQCGEAIFLSEWSGYLDRHRAQPLSRSHAR